MSRFSVSIFLFAFFIFGCDYPPTKETEFSSSTPYRFNLPDWAPLPAVPEENPITKEKVKLGEKLFNDPIFSKNEDVSCASCHKADLAFTDGRKLPIGTSGKLGFRNSPSLLNTAYNTLFFADGGVRSLELQVLVPSDTHFEFDLSIPKLIDKLKKDSSYKAMFLDAFNKPPTVYGITRAIAAYERTLVSFNSKFDKFYYEKDSTLFSESEKRGMQLFFSPKTNCASCHTGIHFTDRGFYNIGLPVNETDPGRIRVTTKKEDFGKFKTPSLRNVAITAPYFHDGRMNTLEEVIEYYNAGGEEFNQKDLRIKPLNLSESQKQDLINFLKTLTDQQFMVISEAQNQALQN